MAIGESDFMTPHNGFPSNMCLLTFQAI
jgi:hypothetical protein